MIGTALVDKLAQEDDQVIWESWDPASERWNQHQKSLHASFLHEWEEMNLQLEKEGSACVLCSAWPALCDLTIRAPSGVGRYASNMTKYATVFISLWPQCERYNNRIYAAGAEPQLHSYKRRKSSKSFTYGEVEHARRFTSEWSQTCFDLNWIRAIHNAKECFFIWTFITSNTLE